MRVFRSQKPDGRHEVAPSAVTLYAKPIRPILDTLRSVIEYRSARGRRWCINNKRRSAVVAVPGCVRTISWTRRQRWADSDKIQSAVSTTIRSPNTFEAWYRKFDGDLARGMARWNFNYPTESFRKAILQITIVFIRHKYGRNYEKTQEIKLHSLVDYRGPRRGEPVGDLCYLSGIFYVLPLYGPPIHRDTPTSAVMARANQFNVEYETVYD